MPTTTRRLAPVQLALLAGAALCGFAACAAAQRTAPPPTAAASAPASRANAAARIPERLADSTYWRLIGELSEPDGFFRSDNLVSNEVTFQYVIPELTRALGSGGVYLGVGPDQNFTYIVALRPKVAFIVDIRRGNLLQHLLYKALIESSNDRADFLSKLFSRPRPAGLASTVSVDSLFRAFERAQPDSALSRRNFAAVKERLLKQHGFAITEDEFRGMEYVHGAFYSAGPELTYSFPGGAGTFGRRRMPTYGELMVQTDSAGTARGYLANEANYRVLRDMQRNNLIVPVVGNFAGDKALRAVGGWLRERNATVSAFYLSNVEQYLFRQDDDWRRFLTNVSTLPLDSSSTFLRSVFNDMSFRAQVPPTAGPTVRSVTLRASIRETLKAFAEGRIQSYYDVVDMSR
jgi:hypothetical protein